jgi:hypothetical protein
MKRSVLSEQQRAAATLLGLGQYPHRTIARMLGVHRNSLVNWLKDPRIQALVQEVQARLQDRLEEGAMASVGYKNTALVGKAIERLEQMLQSKSPKRQMTAIKLLLEYGALPGSSDESQEKPQESREQETFIRIDPVVYNRVQAKQSESIR